MADASPIDPPCCRSGLSPLGFRSPERTSQRHANAVFSEAPQSQAAPPRVAGFSLVTRDHRLAHLIAPDRAFARHAEAREYEYQ